MGRYVLDDHPLAGMGRRAAGAHARADLQAIDRPVVGLRQAGGGGGMQVPALGIQQEKAA